MADSAETHEKYIQTIAMLTVLVQIREGTKSDPTDKNILQAKFVYDRVKGHGKIDT